MDAGLHDSLKAIEASLCRIGDMLEVIAGSLVDPDSDDDDLDAVENAERDQTQPL